MSKFKLGDLIRPKKNPTYLPDEVRMVIGTDCDDEIYVDSVLLAGEKYSRYVEADYYQIAYPVPILYGDIVKLRPDVRCSELFDCGTLGATLYDGVRLLLDESETDAQYEVTESDKCGLTVRINGEPQWYPAAIFDLVKRAEAKRMTHAEIEAALGFRFELEDE